MRIPSNKVTDVAFFFKGELLAQYGAEETELFCFFCFEAFLGFKNKTELISRASETMSESDLLKFTAAIKELKQEKPIQYILGKTVFFNLPFRLTPAVLIPRPETEELVDLVLQEYKGTAPRVLDIGTGSGCIAISLKKQMPLAQVYALDVSEKALAIAAENAALNKVEIGFLLKNILDPMESGGMPQLDLIVSNPPYVLRQEQAGMDKNVLDYEPHLALFVEDNDPLLFYKAILSFSEHHLQAGGRLYFEINSAFGTELIQLIKGWGFAGVTLHRDIPGANRFISATKA
jgi:release factor glutamine methyltransferase